MRQRVRAVISNVCCDAFCRLIGDRALSAHICKHASYVVPARRNLTANALYGRRRQRSVRFCSGSASGRPPASPSSGPRETCLARARASVWGLVSGELERSSGSVADSYSASRRTSWRPQLGPRRISDTSALETMRPQLMHCAFRHKRRSRIASRSLRRCREKRGLHSLPRTSRTGQFQSKCPTPARP